MTIEANDNNSNIELERFVQIQLGNTEIYEDNENELRNTNRDVSNYQQSEREKKEVITKLISKLSFCNTFIFLILFLFSLFFLCAFSNISMNINKQIIISPTFTDTYIVSPNTYLPNNESQIIIKPCIYNEQTITTTNNTNYKFCYPNYELVSVYDICGETILNNSDICLLDNIKVNSTTYFPDCNSIYSLDQIKKHNLIWYDSIAVNEAYYENNILTYLFFPFVPILVAILGVIYVRHNSTYLMHDEIIKLCVYMYLKFILFCCLIFVTWIYLYGSLVVMITSPSIKFFAELITINCSDYDIFEKLTTLQKVLVSLNLNKNYLDVSHYNNIYHYFINIIATYTVFSGISIFYFVLRIACIKI